MNRLIADAASDVFGKITPPVQGGIGTEANLNESITKLVMFGIQFILFFGGLAAFMYLMLAAYDWVVSEGQKEKIQKAQQKMTAAVVGLLLFIVVLVAYNVIMGTILGGKFGIGPDFTFTLPHL